MPGIGGSVRGTLLVEIDGDGRPTGRTARVRREAILRCMKTETAFKAIDRGECHVTRSAWRRLFPRSTSTGRS